MLLVTAENLRENTTTFSTAITFPSPGHVTLPLDRGARRYFDQGETALSRLLPYKTERLVKQLEAVEKGHTAGHDRARLLGDLDRLDRASATMFVPRSIVQDYIDFRQFLHDMRERVGADAE